MAYTVLLGVVCLALNSITNAEGQTVYNHSRLPTSVIPLHYTISIKSQLGEKSHFTGTSNIVLNVRESTENIILHAVELNIESDKIRLNDSAIKVTKMEVNKHQDYIILHLSEKLIANKGYEIEIPFAANFSESDKGYYTGKYTKNENGKEIAHWFAASNFNPIYARKAFPCFDEPALKAKFKIILSYHKTYTGVSNTPTKSRTLDSTTGWYMHEFEESGEMSTYHVAYYIGDFESLNSTADGVLLRIWTKPDDLSQGQYALTENVNILQSYKKYLNMAFPFKKIDQIALPDFASGLVEYYGLGFSQEYYLLYKENVSGFLERIQITFAINRVMAAQWFGSLVTIKWWTDRWIYDGLTSHLASMITKRMHPDWDPISETGAVLSVQIFELDEIRTTTAISRAIEHKNDIIQDVELIFYFKPARLLNMLYSFLGEDIFIKGIGEVLKNYKYKNAAEEDLWNSFANAVNQENPNSKTPTVNEVMNSWTTQAGFPIVEVIRDYSTNSATVRQSRFLLEKNPDGISLDNCWFIPLSYTNRKESDFKTTQPRHWLRCQENKAIPLTIADISDPQDWVIFNIKMSALHRVNYDEKNWNLLADALNSPNFGNIHVANRAQILSDMLALAWIGRQNYSLALNLINYLRKEVSYAPWKVTLNSLSPIYDIVITREEAVDFKNYLRDLLKLSFKNCNGLDSSESHNLTLIETLQKAAIAEWSCKVDLEDCIDEARKLFNDWKQSEEKDKHKLTQSDFKQIVYCTAIRNGTEDDWNFLWNHLQTSTVASEKEIILKALTCSVDKTILVHYLDMTFSGTGAKMEDFIKVFDGIAKQPIGFPIAREYFENNFDTIKKRVDEGPLSEYIRALTNFGSHSFIKSFTDSRKDDFKGATVGVEQALQVIEKRDKWIEVNFNDFITQVRTLVKN